MKQVDFDIDDVLEDVARVLYQRRTGRRQTYRAEMREQGDVVYLSPGVWQNITDSLLQLDRSLIPLESAHLIEVPRERRGPVAWLKGSVKRAIRKSVYWYVNPVIDQLHRTHRATDRALHEIVDQLRDLNNRFEILEKENLGARVGTLENDIATERIAERIGRLERTWREAGAGTTPRGRASVEEVAPGGAVEAERELGRGRSVPAEHRVLSRPFHFDYFWFESIHRGDRDSIKRRQKQYLEHFAGCGNVLDIGCGRGEFLELMAERGIGGYGVDIEVDAIQYCRELNLEVEQEEAIAHLASLPDESLDGAFVSQVVEHLTPSEVIELIGLVFQKMKLGGQIVIETPNPQCLLVFASFFYADLSHVQPIHPETIRFLLLSTGFKDAEIGLTNPVPKEQRLAKIKATGKLAEEPWVAEINSNIDKLNSVLYGYMDYVAVGTR